MSRQDHLDDYPASSGECDHPRCAAGPMSRVNTTQCTCQRERLTDERNADARIKRVEASARLIAGAHSACGCDQDYSHGCASLNGGLCETIHGVWIAGADNETGARCEHSACSQNYIDTGDTACITGGDDE
jgi:hypothetical protein